MNDYISPDGVFFNHDIVARRVVRTRISSVSPSDEDIRQSAGELAYDLLKKGFERGSYSIKHEPYEADGARFIATFGVSN